MKVKKPLIIFGTSSFAEIAYEYFKYDSDYIPVAFTKHIKFMNSIVEEKYSLPVLPFEHINTYNIADYIFIAVGYDKDTLLNNTRISIVDGLIVSEKYKLATYMSTRSFVWPNVYIYLTNNFIFEDNTIQPFVKIGRNNIIWSGNHIGHHSVIGSNNFISSHCVISGHCKIGNNNFIGVNSTILNNVHIGNNCVIGAGALVLTNVPDNTKVKGIWK